MSTVEYVCELDAPLDRVWAFHEDVLHSLPVLSPPGDGVRIESVDLPARVGMKVVITAKGPLGRIRWVAVYAEHEHGVARAWFTDVQQSGPFKFWRHRHEMIALGANRTKLIDHIEYTVPFGPFGKLADKLFVRRKLDAMFAFRHASTKSAVETLNPLTCGT